MSTMRRLAKWMGLTIVPILALLMGPGTAAAQGWRGGGAPVAPHGGYAVPPGGWHGGAVAPAYRGGYYGTRGYVSPGYVSPGYVYPRSYVYPRTYVSPGYAYPYAARPVGRVWVPGYWNLNAGARVWVGGNWAYPPNAGWAWVAPHWAWNGYSWVWQAGYWAPPY